MSFNEIAVIGVFAFLGYLIVSSIQNWLDEKKGKPQNRDPGANDGANDSAPSSPTSAPAPSSASVPPPLPSQAGDGNRRIFAPGMLKDEVETDVVPPELPWYEILEISKDASHEQIVAAYQAKIAEYQPNKMANMPPDIRALAEKRSEEIFAAYERALLVRGH